MTEKYNQEQKAKLVTHVSHNSSSLLVCGWCQKLSALGEVSSRRRRMQVEGTVCSTNMYFYVSSGVHVRALIRVLIEGFVTELYGASGDRKREKKVESGLMSATLGHVHIYW